MAKFFSMHYQLAKTSDDSDDEDDPEDEHAQDGEDNVPVISSTSEQHSNEHLKDVPSLADETDQVQTIAKHVKVHIDRAQRRSN